MTPQGDVRHLARITERAERDAWSRSYELAPPAIADELGLAVHRVGTAHVLVMAASDIPLFNRALGIGMDGPATDDHLDEIIGIYEDAGVSRFVISPSEHAEPADLPARLEARGFAASFRFAKMIRGPDPAPDRRTDLRIEAIGAEHREAYGRVLALGFETPEPTGPLFAGSIGDPEWRHYLAFDGDEPVATSAIHVRDGVAWCGMMTTLETHRGRGVQGAMFARRIQDGLDLGCSWFVTETGEQTPENPNPSYRNMLRVGFELVEHRRNHLRS